MMSLPRAPLRERGGRKRMGEAFLGSRRSRLPARIMCSVDQAAHGGSKSGLPAVAELSGGGGDRGGCMLGARESAVGAQSTASGGDHRRLPPCDVAVYQLHGPVALLAQPPRRVWLGPREARHRPCIARTHTAEAAWCSPGSFLTRACSSGCCVSWNGQQTERRMGGCVMLPRQAFHASGSLPESAPFACGAAPHACGAAPAVLQCPPWHERTRLPSTATLATPLGGSLRQYADHRPAAYRLCVPQRPVADGPLLVRSHVRLRARSGHR
jgi:hypothetical protein